MRRSEEPAALPVTVPEEERSERKPETATSFCPYVRMADGIGVLTRLRLGDVVGEHAELLPRAVSSVVPGRHDVESDPN